MPKRYKQGDPLHISAYAWNRTLDMIGYDVDQNSEWVKGSLPVDWVFCKISFHLDVVATLPDGVLPRGSPVLVRMPVDMTNIEKVEYEINPQDFIHIAEDIAIDDFFAYSLGITLEPINLNKGQSMIGRVAVNGVVYANLKYPVINPGDPMTDNQRKILAYVHPLPLSDPDRATKLQASTSGFAQIVGDHIILGRSQKLFSYEILDSEFRAKVYGVSTNFINSGLYVGEFTLTYGKLNNVSDPIPLCKGDIGLCLWTWYGFQIITRPSANFIAKATTVGTARSGTTAGIGGAQLYQVTNAATRELVPLLKTDNTPVSVTYYNVAPSPIAIGSWIQLKFASGALYIDYEECPTP